MKKYILLYIPIVILLVSNLAIADPIMKDVGLVNSANLLTTFGLTSGAYYKIYATAYNQAGESLPSNTVTFTYNTTSAINSCNPCTASWSPGSPSDIVTGYKLYLTPVSIPSPPTALITK